MVPRPPIQAVIEEQAELVEGRRSWRMALFNEDGTPFSAGGGARHFDVTDAATLDIDGLVTDVTALYELVIDGVVTTSLDTAITARPTGGNITAASIVDRTYQESLSPTVNPVVHSDNGLVLGITGWNTACEILCTSRLSLRADGRARAHSKFAMHPDTNQERIMHGGVASFLKVKQTIESLTIHFGDGTFTGRVSITQIPN